jgi:hypothetical protein
METLDEAIANGTPVREMIVLLGVRLTTLQNWRRECAGDGDGVDRRKD